MVKHLVGSEDDARRDRAKSNLLDLEYLDAKLHFLTISEVIDDYRLLPDDGDLQLVKNALQLSAHILSGNKRQLASQLYGRLFSQRDATAEALIVRMFGNG
jgi:hypothetical protein